MTPFSIRIVEFPDAGGRTKKVLSIHLLRPEISENSFDDKLSRIISSGNQFDAIHFVGFENCIEQAQVWLKSDSSICGRLDLVVVDLHKNARIISFDEKTGKHTAVCSRGAPAADTQCVIDANRRYTLQELFIANNGHLMAPKGFHYIKPSKKHVNIFLRTANVLEDSAAASMIAFWIIPYVWGRCIEHIVVDTSGISDIALTVAYEAICRRGLTKLPIVSTHNSYGGLDRLTIDQPNETLLLISATTSGGLRNKLVKLGAEQENIITLFYLGNEPQKADYTLCDLTKEAVDGYLGLEPIDNYSEIDCPYCKRKSYPVSLRGDQFTFEPPKVEEIHVALSDLPNQHQTLFNQLAGIDFFKVYRNINDRSLEIYLDVQALFQTQTEYRPTRDLLERLSKQWKGMVLRGAPVNLKQIVFAAYPFSKEMADSANGIVLAFQTNSTPMLSSQELQLSAIKTPGTATLVVVSCIDDSHELMAINRDLRSNQPQGNTTYITPVFRADSSRERSRIKSNLTFGENGVNTFNLYSMIDINLPEDDRNHSWDSELKILNEIVNWADLENLAIPQLVTERIRFLELEAPTKGISEKLFWPDSRDKQLQVRPDFTFLNTDGGARLPSQADVFIVISAVLHHLRQGTAGKPKLSYKTYERAILSPDNFVRFNDGVIQSAMLRAARGYELAYANCDEQISCRMKNFIVSHIQNIPTGEGEALMEFLLALASGRLTLHSQHLKEIFSAVQNQSALLPHYQFFAKYLASQAQIQRPVFADIPA
ncbi:hypothetical protein SAMN05216386_2462 [Nitrosospira briensis]|uniref:Uncharacterized protein n=1 Tax=Nitrosospira briensis TaxID=35799 RepID=A0A1I5DYF0_9PROT|nr:hypothetical protein [Nitrosospira briensis]SFO04212.1 hypothetical protein SAMN05216386_2462 [Nitrosospira briensis]